MRTPLPKLLAHPGTLSTFPRKLPTLLGKRGGGLAFRNGARAADSFQLPRRRVRTRNASHPEGMPTPTARPIWKARPHLRRILGPETSDTPRKKLCKNLL